MERWALDTYCKAGGATRGYQLAGFRVAGVDIEPQPRYVGEEFIQADALDVLADRDFLARFDLIHASPPCQDHMRSPGTAIKSHGTGWLLAATRELLEVTGRLWVIENVPGAKMRVDYKLCGCMFHLPNLKRERWFETSWHGFDLRPPCHHPEPSMSVTGTGPGTKDEKRAFGRWPTLRDWKRAMGIDWMNSPELTQAIPPAYTEYVGQRALAVLEAAA